MSIFDKAYDEMSMFQICSRLPGELAIRAIKRRVQNLDSVLSFMQSCDNTTSKIKEISEHVNSILSNNSVDEIFKVFGVDTHPLLFSWLDSSNTKRIKNDGKDKLTTKFKFNLTDSNDEAGLTEILNSVIAEDFGDTNNTCPDCRSLGADCGNHKAKTSARLRSILEKADGATFKQLASIVIASKHPEARESLIGISNYSNFKLLTNNQITIALKAYANNYMQYTTAAASTASTFSSSPVLPMQYTTTLDYKIFSELRPMERLNALERYMSGFPKYRKLAVFKPMPTIDEFKYSLFSCSVEHYERVNKVVNLFMDVTELDPPISDNGNDDE